MSADSNRAATGSADPLVRIAAALESIDARIGHLAGTLEHYRPAIDRAARLAGSPVGKVASALGAFPAPRRQGGHRG